MAVAGPFVLLYELFSRSDALGQLQSSFLSLIVHFSRCVRRQEKMSDTYCTEALIQNEKEPCLNVLRILRSFLKMYDV